MLVTNRFFLNIAFKETYPHNTKLKMYKSNFLQYYNRQAKILSYTNKIPHLITFECQSI